MIIGFFSNSHLDDIKRGAVPFSANCLVGLPVIIIIWLLHKSLNLHWQKFERGPQESQTFFHILTWVHWVVGSWSMLILSRLRRWLTRQPFPSNLSNSSSYQIQAFEERSHEDCHSFLSSQPSFQASISFLRIIYLQIKSIAIAIISITAESLMTALQTPSIMK